MLAPAPTTEVPTPESVRAALLIVVADDFGLTTAVTDGILEAHRRGIVGCAAIMPSARAFEHAADLARVNPELDIGVHLTLDEERPLVANLRTLATSDGRFLGRGRLVRKLVTGRVDLGEVEREWSAQIERVLGAGLEPSFLNGHGHIHAFPSLLPIAARLGDRYRIPAIRRPLEPVRRDRRASALRAVLVSTSARLAFRRVRVRTADRFHGLASSGRLDTAEIEALCDRLPPGVTELMTHPGYADEETRRDYGHWGYCWEAELQALCEARTGRAVLTTFRKLYP